MLLMSERLIGLPIMSLHTGTELGTTERPIIDPSRLQIPAFYCTGPLIDFEPAILHTSDIREFSNIGLIVDSADDIMPTTDLVRLQPILEIDFTLEGKQVVEEGGHKLGKVVDYIVDSDSFFILKLHVRPSLFQSFSVSELIIDRRQIAAINGDTIIVKHASVRDKINIKLPTHAIHNPFRRAQAETAKVHNDRGSS